MARFHIETQGCKANLADSLALAGALGRDGWVVAGGPERADLVIVNTCTVTSRADADARQLVSRIRRRNPAARIVVTGCLAEAAPAEVRAWGAADVVLGNRAKGRLLPLLAGIPQAPDDPSGGTLWDAPESYPLPGDLGHTRGFFKIQDGCDARCSFCIIPRTRGASRSLASERVLAGVAGLARQGLAEVVLTGIHLGHWGRERGERLADLLRALDALEPAPARLRLTSIEPNELDREMVEVVASSPRFAPHFHVPLQSGSDAVLGRMRRPYTAALFARVVAGIHAALPLAGIGADVIAGFPGESEAEFAATEALVGSLPLSYLHVFSYSPRPGTDAARHPGQLDPATVAARRRRLREISARLESAYLDRMTGQRERVLTLACGGRAGEGLSGGFLHLRLDRPVEPNRLVPVIVGRDGQGRALGRVQAVEGEVTT